jgi:hypothetical protein
MAEVAEPVAGTGADMSPPLTLGADMVHLHMSEADTLVLLIGVGLGMHALLCAAARATLASRGADSTWPAAVTGEVVTGQAVVGEVAAGEVAAGEVVTGIRTLDITGLATTAIRMAAIMVTDPVGAMIHITDILPADIILIGTDIHRT